jgi:hypothetical protein
MHNIKPGTKYRLVTLVVAVPESLYTDSSYTDSVSTLMDTAMFESDGSDGFVADWMYTEPRQDHPAVVTGDTVEEGELFIGLT